MLKRCLNSAPNCMSPSVTFLGISAAIDRSGVKCNCVERRDGTCTNFSVPCRPYARYVGHHQEVYLR